MPETGEDADIGQSLDAVTLLDAAQRDAFDAQLAADGTSCVESGVVREVLATHIAGADVGLLMQGFDEGKIASKVFQATGLARVGNAGLLCFVRARSAPLAQEAVGSCLTDLVQGAHTVSDPFADPSPMAARVLVASLSGSTYDVSFLGPEAAAPPTPCPSMSNAALPGDFATASIRPAGTADRATAVGMMSAAAQPDKASAAAMVAQLATTLAACTGSTTMGTGQWATTITGQGTQPVDIGDGGFVVTELWQRDDVTAKPTQLRTWVFSLGPYVVEVVENLAGDGEALLEAVAALR